MVATGKKYAVYHPIHFWLADTCAGGAWSETVEEACWFDSLEEVTAALTAAEIEGVDAMMVCRVR